MTILPNQLTLMKWWEEFLVLLEEKHFEFNNWDLHRMKKLTLPIWLSIWVLMSFMRVIKPMCVDKLLLIQREKKLKYFGLHLPMMKWLWWSMEMHLFGKCMKILGILFLESYLLEIHPDYDLGVPYTWFEYEQDSRLHYLMTDDQIYIPEDVRPYPADKNPHCNSYHWRP